MGVNAASNMCIHIPLIFTCPKYCIKHLNEYAIQSMLCQAMQCYGMRCYAMQCYAMLCYALLCQTRLCYARPGWGWIAYARLGLTRLGDGAPPSLVPPARTESVENQLNPKKCNKTNGLMDSLDFWGHWQIKKSKQIIRMLALLDCFQLFGSSSDPRNQNHKHQNLAVIGCLNWLELLRFF